MSQNPTELLRVVIPFAVEHAARRDLTSCGVLGALTVMIWLACPGEAASQTAGPIVAGLPANVSIQPRLNEQVPLDLVFCDETGREVALRELIDGRPILLNLLYFECPMLCNMVADGMIRTLRTMQFQVGDQFQVLTVSFDPREGPELAAAAKQTALRRYGRQQAAEGWHFLTGDEESIRRLTDAVGFQFEYDEKKGQYAHGAGLFVLTPNGKVSRFLSGVQFLARDIRLGLVEASENKIGTVTDSVLLLCYQYDPTKGKYGLLIMGVIRLAGSLTVFCMVVGFAVMLRRGNRARRNDLRQNSTVGHENLSH